MILSGYQTGDEIERGDNSVLYAAVSQKKKGGEAVVRFRWVEHGPERDTILAAIKRQEFATMAGVPSLAPILAYGQTPAGVYYVTQRYTRSVDALVDGKIAVRPPGLLHVTQSILSGLQTLHARREGAHGNLKLTNILLQGTGRLRDCAVAMTDLSSKKDLPYACDLYSLGMIVLQLVRRRHIVAPDWPVPHSEDWDALDGEGERWREFCSFLLDPARSKDADPVSVAQKELRRMRSKTALGTFGVRLAWTTAVILVLAAGGYAGRNFLWKNSGGGLHGAVVDANADFRWCGRLARELNASPKRVIEDDYASRQIIAPLRGLKLSDADADALASGQPGAKLAGATAVCQNLNAAFAAWQARNSVAKAYEMFNGLRWNVPAASISKLRGDAFSEELPVIEQIEAIALTAKVLPDIEIRWGRIQGIVDRLEKTDDPVLSKIRQYATTAAGEAPDIGALPAQLRQTLDRLTGVEQLWTQADKARLKREGKFTKPIEGTVDSRVLADWEADAKRFQSGSAPGAAKP